MVYMCARVRACVFFLFFFEHVGTVTHAARMRAGERLCVFTYEDTYAYAYVGVKISMRIHV